MYQFSVANPIDQSSAIKLLRKLSGMGVSEIYNAIDSCSPIITLDYRDDLETMEFPEWCEKAKSIYKELSSNFERVIVGYAPAIGDEIEYVTEGEFHNLIESQLGYYGQAHD